jgi:uncharacterized membrane protein (UPF0136 family)
MGVFEMKTSFISLTAGMILGAILFLISICMASFLTIQPLILNLIGVALMLGCGTTLEMFKTRHQLTTQTAIMNLLKR